MMVPLNNLFHSITLCHLLQHPLDDQLFTTFIYLYPEYFSIYLNEYSISLTHFLSILVCLVLFCFVFAIVSTNRFLAFQSHLLLYFSTCGSKTIHMRITWGWLLTIQVNSGFWWRNVHHSQTAQVSLMYHKVWKPLSSFYVPYRTQTKELPQPLNRSSCFYFSLSLHFYSLHKRGFLFQE